MGLANLWGIADLHCRKVKSTKWLKHKLRATIGGQQFEQTNFMSPQLKTNPNFFHEICNLLLICSR